MIVCDLNPLESKHFIFILSLLKPFRAALMDFYCLFDDLFFYCNVSHFKKFISIEFRASFFDWIFNVRVSA